MVNYTATQEFIWKDWRFQSQETNISNSDEIERLQTDIGIPAPTMIFGNNFLVLTYKNSKSPESHEHKFLFDPKAALAGVSKELPDLKVPGASEWVSGRKAFVEQLETVSPYDWTYTTEYEGTISVNKIDRTEEEINIALLSRKDPILYFADNTLFEDELADNGLSQYSVKVRVMPQCFLVLARFYLRLEKVMFRVIETRYYHEFGQDFVLREHTDRQCPYETVSLQASHGELSDLTDINWVCSKIPSQNIRRLEKLTIE